MKYAIDVAFVDSAMRFVGFEVNLRPWSISTAFKNAAHAVEFREGTIKKLNFKIGDAFVDK